MPMSYSKGDMLCGKCHVWIPAREVPTVVYKNNTGLLLHRECGYRVRTKGRRRDKDSIKRWRRRHKPITLGHTVRKDIEIEREKWERLLKICQ